MRRGLIVAAGLAAVLTAAAFGAFTSGNYKGATGKGGAVSFKASQSAVTNFKFSVVLRCSNGKMVSNTTVLSRVPIRKGHFAATTPSIEVKGALNGKKASGTLSAANPSTPVGRNCKSGSLAWTAKRGSPSNAGGLVCAPTASFNGGDLQIDMSCGAAEFDAFIAYIPRPATRADTSTAHLACQIGQGQRPDGASSAIVNCSAQDGVKLKSGRVLIRFSDNATCADADKTTVSALRVGKAEDGPFPLRTSDCPVR
jgi:hypothetical protein